jgi:CRISPR-associated protein Csd1
LSWFKNLVETYDRVSDIAGVSNTKGVSLLPKNHKAAKSDLCLRIDGNGNFRSVQKDKNPLTIIIPCSDDSSIRTNSPCPHPLHENLGYLANNKTKREMYLENIAKWSNFHPKVNAVHKYINGGTLPDDLQKSGIKSEDKLFVRFTVESGQNDNTPNLWEDPSVISAWQKYCDSLPLKTGLCYATGETAALSTRHPPGINEATYGAKLISCNDDTNYTYRGRFMKSYQANAIGAHASHKAHAMLKYLIETQGYRCDSQAVVAWGIEDGQAQANPFASTNELICFDIYSDDTDKIKSDNDRLIEARGKLAFAYASNLKATLVGMGNYKELSNIARRVAVIAVDAATTGRMSVTFYQDMPEIEYINRITAWHESCCWWFRGVNRDYISAPSVDRIITSVYGEPKGKDYYKIKKQARERMLHNIICGERIDRSWVSGATNRVSNPFSYNGKGGGWDYYVWQNAVSTTCAIVRKYYADKKEEFKLELETTRKTRDYLFGRLLAIADRLEGRALWEKEKNKNNEEERDKKKDNKKHSTNAIRYMTAFTLKPAGTWQQIYSQLNPYIQMLPPSTAEWYQGQIDDIIGLFDNPDKFLSNTPLSPEYLLGYSLQRRALKNIKEEKYDAPDK